MMQKWGRQKEYYEIGRLLEDRRGMTFLEFGCARSFALMCGDGHSTVFLAELAGNTGSVLYSCDISPDSISAAKNILAFHGLTGVEFILGDAQAVADTWELPLDFLLIDGCYEWPTDKLEEFADAHKNVFLTMSKWLKKDAVVAVDDWDTRGIKLIPYMESMGWSNHTPERENFMSVMVRS